MALSDAVGAADGRTTAGDDGIQAEKAHALSSETELTKKHDIVLRTFRMLIADLCQQFGGGHPGSAIGMAAIGVALWRYTMRYAPLTPDYFNRDRFVLSNGHACLFQYTFLHLTGYRAMTFDQLKSYHSERVDGICPGHPEIEHEGIEVTTGPLGQGVGNAVGLAIASKSLAAHFNKSGYEVISNHIWCVVGDACLQEGVALEAISYAGHVKLNNLTIIYDNNQITCDGSVDLTNTEDVNTKMQACGWNVIDIEDGLYDVMSIVAALEKSRSSAEKPTFINIRTIIGLYSAVAGQAEAHGAAFGAADVQEMKRNCGFNPEEYFVVPKEVYEFFDDIPTRGEALLNVWRELVTRYKSQFPELGSELEARMRGELPSNWEDLIPKDFPRKDTPSRAASGLVINPIAKQVKSFMVGTADLSPSVHMSWADKVDFQHSDLRTTCGINGNYSGRYLHYGIREHAMCAISNGLAAFAPNTIIPITSSFFMFYLYAAPAVRMGALQRLQVIHAATHDSIGMGEDGPTHQPIEIATLFRAMPNLLYIRPGDSEETAGAWTVAIKAKNTPSIISTSRHKLPQLHQTKRTSVAFGAYVLEEAGGDTAAADLTIIGVGAELSFATSTAEMIRSERGLSVRVVSFPCWRLFEQQPREYKQQVLQRHRGIPTVVIEPYAPNGWERYATAAVCLTRFGFSLPGTSAYKYFGFDSVTLNAKIGDYIDRIQDDESLKNEFLEL